MFPKCFHSYEERRDKEGVKKGRRSNMNKIPKFAFLTYIQKKSKHPFLGTWSLFLVHYQFTPSHGPKGFKRIFKNRTMKM